MPERSTTLLRDAATRGTLAPGDPDQPTSACGLTVFGVGGLGAGELTYSSPLSLFVLFDPERVQHRGRGEPTETLHRLVRDLVSLLGDGTGEGCVYQTDLKFRAQHGRDTARALDRGCGNSTTRRVTGRIGNAPQ